MSTRANLDKHHPQVSLDYKPAANQEWIYPNYQVVCVSKVRLGDCGTYYYVKDSVASVANGQKYCWLLLTDEAQKPAGGLPNGDPDYDIVCYSRVRLGDCGTYWRVKDSTEGTMTDGTRALWLLVE